MPASVVKLVAGEAFSFGLFHHNALGALVGGFMPWSIGAALGLKDPRKRDQPSPVDPGRLITKRQPITHWQWIYGQTRVGGAVTYMEASADNQFLHMVITLAGHECQELGEIWFDEETITLDGSGDATGRLAGFVHIEKSKGDEASGTQPFPNLVSAGLSWTSAHKQTGRAKLWVRLKYSGDLFPNGIPNITCIVKGRKVWDPRLGSPTTRQWSANAALCVADYLMNAQVGLGATESEINTAKLIAAANICDEQVARNLGSPTQYESRYTLNGAFNVSGSPRQTLPTLLTAMGPGYARFIGGTWHICPAAYATPAITLGENDLRGGLRVLPRLSRRELCNGVKGIYSSPDNRWQPSDFPPVTKLSGSPATDPYLAEDQGERIWKELDLPFTTSAATAQRIAKIELERTRQQISVEWKGNLGCYRLQPGDTVMVTLSRYGWSAKEFEVLASTLVFEQADEQGGVILGCDLLLRETASAVYAWLSSEETVLDQAPDTNLPNPFTGLTITGLTATSGTADLFVNGDGTVVPRIRLRWTEPASVFVKFYEVQSSRLDSSPTAWVDAPDVAAPAAEAFAFPVEDAVAYDVRIRAVTNLGNAGDWAYVRNHTVVGKTQVPSDVTGATAVQTGSVVVMGCNPVTDADLDAIEVRLHDEGQTNYADATPVANILRGETVTSAAIPPGTWELLFKARDTSGNYSANAARVSISVTATGFTVIAQQAQAPQWLGPVQNMVKHWTGVLTPESQSLASALDWEVFDQYVPNAFTDCYYEAPLIDKSIDSPARIYGDVVSVLGPGETGVAAPKLEIDHRTSSGSFDGFEVWTVGSVEFRYLRARIHVDTTIGKPVISQFTPTIDAESRDESGTLTVGGGGSGSVTFVTPFHATPVLQLTPEGSGDVSASYSSLTSTGFTGHFKTGGVAGAGSMSYTATGA